MTVTALRMQFPKLKPGVLFLRDYTKFSNETFISSLKVILDTQSHSPDENGFLNFCKIYTETLNKHTPRKRKTIRGNQSSFINKEISKTIMKRTEVRNKSLKHKTDESRHAFDKQRNFMCLLGKSKRNYYSNLNAKDITDSKKFWKTIKPLFSDKKRDVTQDDAIPVKILKENVNDFAEYIFPFYHHAITTSKFPSFLKMANVTPIFKKGRKKREILGQSAFYRFCGKFPKN